MKKLIIAILLFICSINTSEAQEIAKNAVGIRVGSFNSFVGEVAYQRGLSDIDRLEFNLGYKKSTEDIDSFKFTSLYQWVWYIDKRFYWFLGAGGGLGFWTNDSKDDVYNGEFIFATGDIGIEYSFCDTPITLALDYRPEMNFSDFKENNKDNFRANAALSIKFRF
mgnify:FL=1